MMVVGLTGGIGTGKSVVADTWADLGATVLEADLYGHRVLNQNRTVQRQLVKVFGREILCEDGTLDRAAIASAAFRSRRATSTLNRIVGRPLVKALHADIARLRKGRSGVLVVDAALLCEWRAGIAFDLNVLVTAPRASRLRWLSARGVPYRRAAAIMRTQWPDSRKRRWAHVIVRNDGTPRELRRKATAVWRQCIDID